jgi:hypothetical protein
MLVIHKPALFHGARKNAPIPRCDLSEGYRVGRAEFGWYAGPLPDFHSEVDYLPRCVDYFYIHRTASTMRWHVCGAIPINYGGNENASFCMNLFLRQARTSHPDPLFFLLEQESLHSEISESLIDT